MKKVKHLLFSTALLAAVAFSSSCKKTGDPGPAGKDGNRYPYKQPGTTLNVSGNFNSDDASFDNTVNLPFFATLEDNHTNTYYPALRTTGTFRTDASSNTDFHIVRYDSIGNSTLSFDITYDYNDNIYVNDFHFNVKTNVTETSYRKVYTTYGGGALRVSGPDDQESSLSDYDLNNNGNSFTISNWNYNATTNVLSFDYTGILVGGYNSTGNSLNVSGKVKANLKEESLRIAQ